MNLLQGSCNQLIGNSFTAQDKYTPIRRKQNSFDFVLKYVLRKRWVWLNVTHLCLLTTKINSNSLSSLYFSVNVSWLKALLPPRSYKWKQNAKCLELYKVFTVKVALSQHHWEIGPSVFKSSKTSSIYRITNKIFEPQFWFNKHVNNCDVDISIFSNKFWHWIQSYRSQILYKRLIVQSVYLNTWSRRHYTLQRYSRSRRLERWSGECSSSWSYPPFTYGNGDFQE